MSKTRFFSLVSGLSLVVACSSGGGSNSGGGSGGGGATSSGGVTTTSSGGSTSNGGSSTSNGGATTTANTGGTTAQPSAGTAGSSTSSQGGSTTGGTASGGAGGSTGGAAGGASGGSGGRAGGTTSTTQGTGGATGGATSAGTGGKGSGGNTAGGTTGSGGGATGGKGGSAGGTTSGVDAGTSTSPTDGGAGSLVTPSLTGTSTYRFVAGDVTFEVDAAVGGRVKTLSLGSTNLIVSSGTATDKTDYGSVFWTSPRNWKPKDWPPPAAYDQSAYTVTSSDTHLALTGPMDSTMGIGFDKDYSVDGTTGWIKITYTIKSNKAVQVAPWEDTRVPRGGIAFFPQGTTAPAKGPFTTQITITDNIVWVDDSKSSATSPDGSKMTADGADGWEAYALSGVLFLKKFVDTPANQQVPSSASSYVEGEIGIYPGTGFIEFEVEGPYTQIQANGTLPWSVQWRAVKIPSSVTVAVSSATLVAFAKEQAGL